MRPGASRSHFTRATTAVARVSCEPLERRVLFDAFVVENSDDGGAGSLRDALERANANPGPHTITFGPGVSIIDVNSPLSISSDVTISAVPRSVSVRSANPTRVFEIASGANVTLTSVSIVNGRAEFNGGGILNLGSLTLDHCQIVWCKAGRYGGAIYNDFGATLRVKNDTNISNNTAADGGGVANDYGTVTVDHSEISNNSAADSGGGIYCYTGSVTATDSTFTGNSAKATGGGGGGIFNNDRLAVIGCKFDGNKSLGAFSFGGGIHNSFGGTATVDGSTFEQNLAADGSGIGAAGTISVTNSAINNGTATLNGGGVYLISRDAVFVNTTISGNTCVNNGSGTGGGVFSTGTAAFINCAIIDNHADQAGGARILNNNTSITNSVVANNTAGSANAPSDIVGTAKAPDSHADIIGTGGSGGLVDGVNGVRVGVDPLMYPVFTGAGGIVYRPLQGSIVINNGDNNALPQGTALDACGGPRFVDGTVDIGPCEFPANPVVVRVVPVSTLWARKVINYEVARIDQPLMQLQVTPELLPWSGLDQVIVLFDRGVRLEAGHLKLVTPGLPDEQVKDLEYDAPTHRAIFTLDRPLPNQSRVTLDLVGGPGGVTDATTGAPLDGNGDGVGGDDFIRDFGVLFGDVDGNGRTDGRDLLKIRKATGSHITDTETTPPVYDLVDDLNGDGQVDPRDLMIARSNLGRTFPPPVAAAAASLRSTSVPEIRPLAPALLAALGARAARRDSLTGTDGARNATSILS